MVLWSGNTSPVNASADLLKERVLHAVATHLCINLQEARGGFCLLSRHSYTTILSMKILIIRNIRKWNRPGSPPVPCNGLLRGKEGFSWGYKGGGLGEGLESDSSRQKIPDITTSVSITPRGAKRTYRERTCAPIKNAFVTYVR